MNFFSSSCLDSLVTQFCSDVKTTQKKIWDKITVITPNSYVKQYLVSEFCLKNEASINWQFSTLTQKLLNLQEGENLHFASIKILNLAILEELSLNLKNYPLFSQLVSGSEKKLSYLCLELAKLFFSYIFYCPQLIKNWLNNKNNFLNKEKIEEEQKKLFFNIVENKNNIISINNIAIPQVKNPPKKDKEKIFIFYPDILTELHYKLIKNLEKSNIFFIYQFVVCQEFFEDIGKKFLLLQDKQGYENSLLNFWGSRAREQAKAWSTLEENLGNKFQNSLLEPMQASCNQTILQKVQKDIRYRRETKHSKSIDESLRFFSFPSQEEEIEFIYEEILFEIQNCQTPINEIAILVPKMSEYKEKIQFIFSDIPHIIIDYSIAEESFLVRFLRDFFLFYQENLKKKFFFNILSNPIVQSKFLLTFQKIEKLFLIAERYKLFWGYDSWDEVLKEIRVTLFESESDENLNFEDREDSVLLYNIVKGFLDKKKFLEQKHKISDWVNFVKLIIAEYTQWEQDFPKEQEIYKNLDSSLNNINKIYEKSSFNIGVDILEEIILQEVYALTRPIGREGIVISEIKPMTLLKVQSVFVLGFDEKSFPSRETTTIFDLKQSYRGELKQTNQTENEEYTFLEILMNAQKKMYLSFVHQTQEDQIPMMQSPIISQIIYFLKKQNPNGEFAVERMTQKKIENFHQRKTWLQKNIEKKKNLFYSPNSKKGVHFDKRINGDDSFFNVKDLALSLSNPFKFFFLIQLAMKESFIREKNHKEIFDFKEQNLNNFIKKVTKESFNKNISPEEIIEREFLNEQKKGNFLQGFFGEKQKKKILNLAIWDSLRSLIKKDHYKAIRTNLVIPFKKKSILLEKDCLLYQNNLGNYILLLVFVGKTPSLKNFHLKDILTSFFLLKKKNPPILEIKLITNNKIMSYIFKCSLEELTDFLELLIKNYAKQLITQDEINLLKKDLLGIVPNKHEKEMSNELIKNLLEQGKEQGYNKRLTMINHVSKKLGISESNNSKFLQLLRFLFTNVKADDGERKK